MLALEGMKEKKLHKGMRGGGGQSDPPPPPPLFSKVFNQMKWNLVLYV